MGTDCISAEEKERAERHAALRQVEVASMKARGLERVDQLWLVRLYRKTLPDLTPMAWWEVLADYDERWCQLRGIWYQRKNGGCTWFDPETHERPDGYYSPDLDCVRCIVMGWADGTAKQELTQAVERWRKELQPAIRLLKPVTNGSMPGQPLLTYVTENLPRLRPRLDQIVDTWPDSPLALAKLLADFSPILNPLEWVDQMSKASPLVAIATNEELSSLRALTRRGSKLAEILADAKRSLQAMGWAVTEDGKLQALSKGRGRRALSRSHLFRGLYCYLWPIYRRTFGDPRRNPDPLREHISGLLSPYFEPTEISSRPKGPIGSVIDKFVHRDKRAAALLAEPYP